MRSYNLFVLDRVYDEILNGQRNHICFSPKSRFAKRVKIGSLVVIQKYPVGQGAVLKKVVEKCMVRCYSEDKPRFKYPYLYIVVE